ELVFARLEECLYQRIAGQVRDTLLVVSADHGQTRVDLTTPTYVNLELPRLVPMLRTTRAGAPIRFAGSARDLFLYVRPECLAEAGAMLREHLLGRAEVWRTREMVEQGFFGPGPYDRLWPRLGDLVILPHSGQSVFWFEEGKFSMRHKGSHGGLTPEEMDTGVYLLEL